MYKCINKATLCDMGSVVTNLSMETNRAFLELFLHTTPEQQIALVSTATSEQVKIFTEIAYNLPKLTDLSKHQNFLVYLGDQKHSQRYKKQLLKKHATRFVKAIDHVNERLLDLLK